MCGGFDRLGHDPLKTLDRLPLPAYIWAVRSKVISMTPDDVFRLRTQCRMTQAAFGQLIGVTVTTVARWEGGTTKVSTPYSVYIRMLVDEYKKSRT